MCFLSHIDGPSKKDEFSFMKKPNFFLIYATASIFLLIIVVGFHGLWQLQKGKQALYKVLYDQGNALVESLQTSGKNAIISNILSQEILINRLLDNANLIDLLIEQNGHNSLPLQKIVSKNNLFRLQVVDPSGRVLFDSINPLSPAILNVLPWQKQFITSGINPILRGEQRIIVEGLNENQHTIGNLFWVAVARNNSQGAIIIHVDAHYIDRFRREIGLKKIINDIAEQEGIQYVLFQDLSLKDKYSIIAPDESSYADLIKEKIPFDKTSAKLQKLSSGKTVYEISKPFIFQGKVLGFFRVGLSLDKFSRIIHQTQSHTLWFSLLIILLGSGGLSIIFYHQYLQYKRYKVLEESFQRTERLKSIGKLAAGVAHEIRNPLNAIGMTIQRLQHEYLPEQTESREEFIQFTKVIRQEVRRVDKIIGNFLNFAKEPKLEIQSVDITSIINDLSCIFSQEAKEQGVTIHTQDNQNPLSCLCDPNQIKQALINIIRNALQAMANGGPLWINSGTLRDNIFISIKDTGEGIADIEKIFEIYFTTKEDGIGLGLPISQKIIEEHGGKIKVNSKQGEGTEFHIYLPLKPRKYVVEKKSP